MRLVAVLLAFTLVGCAASGVKVTEEQLGQFKAGETTIEQAIAAFGQPTSRTRMADGSISLMYVFTESTVRPQTLIPFVGAFIGGADATSNLATLRFDPSGKLLDTTSSTTQIGSGMGFSAGQPAPIVTDQPRR